MTILVKRLVPIMTCLAVLAGAALTPAAADEAAETYVGTILDEYDEILASETEADLFDGIAVMVDKHVDMRRVALFALGQYARDFGPDQKEDYIALFRRYATLVYQNALSEYSGQKLYVVNSVDRSDRDIIVNSKVEGARPGQQYADLVVHWRVYRNRDGEQKIVDAGANDVWLAIEQRSQFTSIVGNNGGGEAGIAALMEEMEKQLGDG